MSLPKLPRKSCAIFASLFLTTSLCAQDAYDPNRFEKTELASQLIQPMAMAVAPDDSIFLIEIGGSVKRIDSATGQSQLVGKVAVTTEQENGLIGIALDPKFVDNQWIYLQYSPPGFSGQYISRFRLKDGQLDLESEKLLLKYEEQRQECCHHAGEMTFGPDGCLYIGTGDNTNPFGDSEGYAPIDGRERMSAFTALRTASNTKSYNGKVLRIRPTADGGYEIPAGNLFPADGSEGLPEIYVMGCRNPWRISVDPRSGDLYWGDVGPDAGEDGPRGPRGYDEVNQAKKPGYFGWPMFIADNKPYIEYDYSDRKLGVSFDPKKPRNLSPFNTGAKDLPPATKAWIYYPAGSSKEFPEVGSGGRTACAGPAYYYDPSLVSEVKLPRHFDNCLFIFEWSRNWIMTVHRNADGSIKSLEPFLPQERFVRPIDIEFDSKGSMLVIEYGETWGVNPDAKLVRLDYVRGNRVPNVKIQASTIAGKEPLQVRFSSQGTVDRDGEQLSYQWKVLKNGDLAESKLIGTEPDLEWTAMEPGVYSVALEVSDSKGGLGIAQLAITVGNSLPVVDFVKPRQGDFYSPGETLAYRVKITDLEDGTTDEEEMERLDLDFIDADASNRAKVQASLVAAGDKEGNENLPSGLKRIRASDCLNCHSIQSKLVGPSFLEVAEKYRTTPGELDKSVERVLKGSTGVWGKVAMLPHSQYKPEEAREMVEWIYSVQPDASSEYRTGISNQFDLLSAKADFQGKVRITANYVDLGNGAIPPLTGSKTIELRSRTTQAEDMDEIHDMGTLGSHNAGNGKFCGSINHGSYMRANDVVLGQVSGVTARVTSAGAGGQIEVRVGSIDGPVLCTLPVRVNGDWDGWYEVSEKCDFSKVDPIPERSDLYFVCTNEKNRGALMNIDWIRFEK